MCLYPRYSSACTDQAAQGLDGTGQPWTPLALVTAEVSGLAPGVECQIAVTTWGPVGSDTRETVCRFLQNKQPVTLELSSLPWQVPTAPPSSGQEQGCQLPIAEGVEARIDIP